MLPVRVASRESYRVLAGRSGTSGRNDAIAARPFALSIREAKSWKDRGH